MSRNYSLLLALAVLAGCDSSTGPNSEEASYSLQVSGDQDARFEGMVIMTKLEKGFAEIDPSTGARTDYPATIIGLITKPGEPSISLGLIGPLQLGTYRVQQPRTSGPSFYGDYMIPLPTGERKAYSASEGTVTITSLEPVKGTFNVRSNSFVVWPANTTVGTTVHSQPGSLSWSGSFTVTRVIAAPGR